MHHRLLALALLLPTPAAALEPVAEWSLSAAGFPAGAETAVLAGLRQPLWDREGDLLLSETYLQVAGIAAVTPAFARGGLDVAWQPATVFELRARYQLIGYFGTFSAILPYADPDAPYGADDRVGRDRTHGLAHRATAQPTLRAKLGPVVILGWSSLRWEEVYPARFDADLDYWVEPELGLMVARSDVTVDSNALVALELPVHGPTVYTGIFTTLRNSVDAGDRLYRAGPAGVYTTASGHWTVFAIVQAYIEDRNYTQPLPPFIAGRLMYKL